MATYDDTGVAFMAFPRETLMDADWQTQRLRSLNHQNTSSSEPTENYRGRANHYAQNIFRSKDSWLMIIICVYVICSNHTQIIKSGLSHKETNLHIQRDIKKNAHHSYNMQWLIPYWSGADCSGTQSDYIHIYTAISHLSEWRSCIEIL